MTKNINCPNKLFFMRNLLFVLISFLLIANFLIFIVSAAVTVHGTALYYFSGNEVDGNVTVIPTENPKNKTTTNFTNGEWSVNFDMITDDVETLTFVINDDGKLGYSQVKLDNRDPKKITDCAIQNISLSGYAVDVNAGNQISSGTVRIFVLGTAYTNVTSFTDTWSIDLHPCLISGKIYTLHILVSDTGKIGEMFYNYPAR